MSGTTSNTDGPPLRSLPVAGCLFGCLRRNTGVASRTTRRRPPSHRARPFLTPRSFHSGMGRGGAAQALDEAAVEQIVAATLVGGQRAYRGRTAAQGSHAEGRAGVVGA